MSNSRIVPHRPVREERKAHELADLKRENNQLKRAVTRLRKEVSKRVADDLLSDIDESQVSKHEVEARVILNQCPKCEEGIIKVIELGERVFHICDACKDRKRVN
jgi:formamidopyrimidine-DNA glycosylase